MLAEGENHEALRQRKNVSNEKKSRKKVPQRSRKCEEPKWFEDFSVAPMHTLGERFIYFCCCANCLEQGALPNKLTHLCGSTYKNTHEQDISLHVTAHNINFKAFQTNTSVQFDT